MLDLSPKAQCVFEYLNMIFQSLFIAQLIICSIFSLAWLFLADWCHMAITNSVAKQCGISTLWHWVATHTRTHTYMWFTGFL